jgi:hypothetical protein
LAMLICSLKSRELIPSNMTLLTLKLVMKTLLHFVFFSLDEWVRPSLVCIVINHEQTANAN